MTKSNTLERQPRIRAYLSSIREGLIRDLGPREEDLTTAQLALVNHTISKLGVLRLIEEHVQGHGIFKMDGSLDPALGKFWLAASNSLRLDLLALGIHTRKGDEGLSLERYIDLKAEAGPGAAPEQPEPGPEAAGVPGEPNTGDEGEADPEIVDPGASTREICGGHCPDCEHGPGNGEAKDD